MNCSPALKWFIALLLPLIFAWKLAVVNDSYQEPTAKIVEFLSQNQFDVTVTDDLIDFMPVLHARSGSCSIVVAKASTQGWNRQIIRNLARPSDRILNIFHGRVYEEQPTWLTIANYQWSRFLRSLGLARYTSPVIVVVESLECNAESLPWSDLHQRLSTLH